MDAMFAPIGAMVATGGYIFKIISSITITDKRNYILQLKVPEGSWSFSDGSVWLSGNILVISSIDWLVDWLIWVLRHRNRIYVIWRWFRSRVPGSTSSIDTWRREMALWQTEVWNMDPEIQDQSCCRFWLEFQWTCHGSFRKLDHHVKVPVVDRGDSSKIDRSMRYGSKISTPTAVILSTFSLLINIHKYANMLWWLNLE